MARLLADENFPLAAVLHLRTLGHDVETALEAGLANRALPDDELLAYATSTRRAVLTLNRRDFVRLHRQPSDHAGIVICTRDADSIGLATRIDVELEIARDPVGKLLRVNRPPNP
jgi:hypothetical protein